MIDRLTPDEFKLLDAILETGHRLESVWPSSQKAELETLTQLKSLIATCKTASSQQLNRLSFHAEGCTPEMTSRHLDAVLVPFERLSRRQLRDDQFLIHDRDAEADEVRTTVPFRVIADNIRSSFNVGAIFRTAEALGLESVALSGYTSTPKDEKTSRTAMGSAAHIPWRHHSDLSHALTEARAEGFSIIALETAAEAQSLDDFQWPARAALVLGNERFGLDAATLNLADHVVKIPLRGRKNSLNVAIAFAIAAQDFISKTLTHSLSAIGTFHCEAQHAYEARRQGSIDQSGEIATITLNRGALFEQALKGLAQFDRIWVLFGFHHNSNWKPMVHPPRSKDKQGVFATRSPHRPNGLGLSALELVSIDDLTLKVRGFDLLDGSPIYDIKPYLPYADSFPQSRAGWTEAVVNEHEVTFSAQAETQLAWLESHGVSQMRGFVLTQLSLDPDDGARKRLIDPKFIGAPIHLCYRTWRAAFVVDRAHSKVHVLDLSSGYSAGDLSSEDDRYQDKSLHRLFKSQFPDDIGDQSRA